MDAKIEDALKDIFSYHAPQDTDVAVYNKLRNGALEFARVVMEECPPGADRMAAVRKIREAVMTANAAVALKGRSIPVAPEAPNASPQTREGVITSAIGVVSEMLREVAPGALEKARAGEPERIYESDEKDESGVPV